jgi:protein-S-isoprenylcysteine O-methyltransferase Ste14
MYAALRPPLARAVFARRMLQHLLFAGGLLVFSMAIGMAGYEHFENLEWRDAFLDTAMLLGGMGPVHTPMTNAGKIFAGLFALYAGIVFLFTAGLMIAPIVHRIMHRFHWEQSRKDKD